MQLKLINLTIKNFKSIKNFELDLRSESAVIAGKNGTGKTTIADAYFYLLTDSDLDEQTKFNILELQKSGAVIDNQNASVEAEFSVDDRTIKLKKEYRQVWSKKRGASERELVRHTTKHFFDDVPVKKNEFIKELTALVDIDIIRSISDVHFFCGRLPWEKRREILMMIAGDISYQDLCEQFGAKELAELLGNKGPDALKKILKSKKQEIKVNLDELPGRIDELYKMIPDLPDQTYEQIIEKLGALEKIIDSKKNDILAIKSGLDVSEKKKLINDLKIEKSETARQVATQLDIDEQDLFEQNRKILRERSKIVEERDNEHNLMTNSWSMIRDYKEEKATLIKKWNHIDSKKFEAKETCFACGQTLPEDIVADQESEFKNKQATDLKPINERGRWLTDEIKRIESEEPKRKERINELEILIIENADAQDDIKKRLDTINERKAAEITSATQALAGRIELLQDESRKQMQDIAPSIDRVEVELVELDKELGALQSQRLDFITAEKCKERIEQRKEQLNFWGRESEEVERKLNMLSKFSEWKSSYIEQNVNDKFKLANWSLFEVQVNGGIKEICEATFDGVPYSTDLNTGSKINLGLDCIITLQKHYNISMPIFIDNAESVTAWMIESDQQIIKLIASADINELEVMCA